MAVRGATCLVTVVLALGWSSRAGAQSTDPVGAQTLFDDGRALLNKGAFDAACPKLAASQRLDPAVGTLLSIGECEEGRGHTASAWLAYREATSLAMSRGDEKRRLFATTKAAALEPRLARIVIRVAATTPGLTIHRDGVVVDPAIFGTATPTDPGSHVIDADAPGRRPWSSTVVVRAEGSILGVDVPALAPAGPEPSAVPPGDARAVPDEGSGGRAARRTIALFVGGAGVVGVGVGAAFGFTAISKWGDVSSKCPAGRCPSNATVAQEADAKSSASSAATVSTLCFGLGAAALAAGVVLWFTAPRDPAASSEPTVRVAPIVGDRTGGAALLGTF